MGKKSRKKAKRKVVELNNSFGLNTHTNGLVAVYSITAESSEAFSNNFAMSSAAIRVYTYTKNQNKRRVQKNLEDDNNQTYP